jgi:hypothetical protein
MSHSPREGKTAARRTGLIGAVGGWDDDGEVRRIPPDELEATISPAGKRVVLDLGAERT